MTDDAFTLWQRFMDHIEHDPWLYGTDGTLFCLFCEGESRRHETGCDFLAVKDMLTRTTVTPVPARFEE